ncbi:AMP-binding protein [Phytoactinopolyspora limicola]|uniref:AMP-binding protein n=1 Tax=Phytoactinopolyspora limicola TaxID=2715536 RepID=UPI00140D6440|nr:AMP-binding protein [Phytoactinopolyspora limicola]
MDLIGQRNVRDLWRERAYLYRERTFLTVDDGVRPISHYTYGQSLDEIRRVAAGFTDLEVVAGDPVLLHLGDGPELTFSWFALMWLGAVAVPVATTITRDDLDDVVQGTEPVAAVTNTETDDPSVEPGDPWTLIRAVTYEQVRAAQPVSHSRVPKPEDPAQVVVSPGARPTRRVITLTHANCLHAGEHTARALALDHSDTLLTTFPLHHVNAQAATVLPALTIGAHAVLVAGFHPARYLEQVRRHEATVVNLSGSHLRALLAQPPDPSDRDHHVRRCLLSTVNVSDGERLAFERRFGIDLVPAYGVAEAMMLITAAPVFGERRWPSVGLPVAGREVRIVDDSGVDVAPGQMGELICSGEAGRTLMQGYHGRPRVTEQAIRDGWLHTDHYAYTDEYGYVYVVDRKTDMIRRSGTLISPTEVERVLIGHDLVADVAVVGIPDPVIDEAVHAWIVPAPGAQLTKTAVIDYCHGRLTPVQTPTSVKFLDHIPRSTCGEANTSQLRHRAARSA